MHPSIFSEQWCHSLPFVTLAKNVIKSRVSADCCGHIYDKWLASLEWPDITKPSWSAVHTAYLRASLLSAPVAQLQQYPEEQVPPKDSDSRLSWRNRTRAAATERGCGRDVMKRLSELNWDIFHSYVTHLSDRPVLNGLRGFCSRTLAARLGTHSWKLIAEKEFMPAISWNLYPSTCSVLFWFSFFFFKPSFSFWYPVGKQQLRLLTSSRQQQNMGSL